MTEAETLFSHGIIAPWYLRDDQLPAYEHLVAIDDPFFEFSRRYGKTTTILTYVMETLIQNSGFIARLCEPEKNQAREILFPEIEKIQKFAKKYDRFEWKQTDSHYSHRNGSKIYLRGVNHDRGDSARGAASHIIVADEFGSWKDPDYIVNSALRPQLQTTKGKLIFASTPPEDLGHAYYSHKNLAIKQKRFLQRTIYQNESLTIQEIEAECEKMGGKDSPAWRREYLCEPVATPERLVIPEFKESTHIYREIERPSHYTPYVGIDLGFNDFTAFLFGYYDFRNDQIIIEDELLVNGKNSQEIVTAARSKEKALWGDAKVTQRWSDNDPQLLYDMNSMFGYVCYPTRKDDKQAAVNALRLRFAQNKIKIHEKCESAIFQLKVGMWNDRRTDFVRGVKTGHLDALDALIYMNRNINPQINPYPALDPSITEATHFIDPALKQPGLPKSNITPGELSLAKIYGSRF